jgi:RNA recognition motif-containing protein
LDATLK